MDLWVQRVWALRINLRGTFWVQVTEAKTNKCAKTDLGLNRSHVALGINILVCIKTNKNKKKEVITPNSGN